MTSSRSNKRLQAVRMAIVVVALGCLGFFGHEAWAGRKRVVVLDFEGPKADKFHDEVVKLIKKSHTVVPTDKWNGTADELDAGKLTAKNIKKVAKKLKIDGIITGKIEKRRDEYIIRMTLREGKGGEQVGQQVDTKSDSIHLEGKALRDVKEELVDAIDQLDANRASGGDDDDGDKPAAKKKMKKDDDDDDKPVAKKKAKKTDDDDDDKPAAKKKVAKKDDDDDDKPAAKKPGAKKDAAKKTDDDDDDKPVKKGFVKKTDDERGGDKVAAKKKDDAKKKPAIKDDAADPKKDDDESPLPKAKKKPVKDDVAEDDGDGKKKKKVATKDDDGNEVEATAPDVEPMDAGAALSPSERAIDAVAGLSITQRKLGFTYSSNLGNTPPGYRGVPVAGLLIDATIYPLAVGHKREDMLKNLGFTVMFDRVLHIVSQVKLADGTVSKLSTSEQRFALGASFRYPIGKGATAPVVGATLRVGQQAFSIDPGSLTMMQVDIPNVTYLIIDPEVFVHYPVTPKITLSATLGFEAIAGAGDISQSTSYGAASVSGFEGEISADYLFTKNIFARAAFRFETIGFSFKGTGDLSKNRDGDATTQDVFGARDTYLGGAVTVGYLY